MGNSLKTLPQIPPPPQQQEQQLREIELENQEFTCEICIEPTSNPDKKFKNANKCSHPFCTDCMIKYIRIKLEDDNVCHIKCPAFNCDHMLEPLSCSSLVGPTLFLRWSDVLCEEANSGLENCYCPYNNCNVLIVNECGGDPKKCKCPSCKRWFCFQCKSVWHAGYGCEESEEFMRDFDDVAFRRLVEQMKWSRCPRCRHFIESRGGCSTIKCRCGIIFCYKCGEQFHQNKCGCENTPSDPCWTCVLCTLLIFLFFVIEWHIITLIN